MKSLHIPSVLLGLALSVAASGAAAQSLLAPEADDLAVRSLSPGKAGLPPSRPDVPREPVAFSWPLEVDRALDLRPAPAVQRSKEFWLQASAADLRRGIELPVAAPGALVRVNPAPAAGSPAAKKAAILDPARLELVDDKGQVHKGAAALDRIVTAEQLAAADSPFPEGTAAFRLSKELGAGRLVLRAPDLAAGPERYVVHVLDQASDLELALRSERGAYLAGDVLTVETALLQGGLRLDLDEVTGHLVAPTGEAWPVRFEKDGTGAWQASAPLAGAAAPGGLWEVEVTARGEQEGQKVLRGVRTAFAVAAPTARFTGAADPTPAKARGAGRPAVTLEVEAAAAGRYEVRGVLFGTDARGELRPAAVAHAAAWLEPGRGRIELVFDPAALAQAGLQAPFEVRDLQLLDQGRMGLLHRQARGLVLP